MATEGDAGFSCKHGEKNPNPRQSIPWDSDFSKNLNENGRINHLPMLYSIISWYEAE